MDYVLITGASSGLGRELALVFARNGYNILIGYNNNIIKATELESYIKNNYKVDALSIKINIVDEENVKEVFNKYNISILINNASLSNDNYIEDKTFNEFMDVVKVNLGGVYLMSKYAKNTKTIINISSTDGIDTYSPISLDYSASKAGIINLSKNLSLYYKDKRILCICPNWINTESVLSMNPNYLKKEMERINQKELLDKEYVAKRIFDIFKSNIKSGSVVRIDE